MIDRLRPKLQQCGGRAAVPAIAGATGIRAGGRQGNGNYQYTIQADTLDDLNDWVPKITEALQDVPELQDVNSDQQDKGLEVDLKIDRATAARLGLNATQIDNTLYDAFGQRQVSTIYKDKNQYHVVMEVAPDFWQSPETLRDIYVSTSGGTVSGTQSSAGGGRRLRHRQRPPATGASSATRRRPADILAADGSAAQRRQDAVRNQQLNAVADRRARRLLDRRLGLDPGRNHGAAVGLCQLRARHHAAWRSITRAPFVATTFSFNLPAGEPMSRRAAAIHRTMAQDQCADLHPWRAAGTAQLFQKSLANLPFLLLAAILTIYIVLGILYESLIHPVTILSTLPSAGVGAVLALLIFKTDFSLIAMIGVILLIGIVKKNAIIMIDFAIDAAAARRI